MSVKLNFAFSDHKYFYIKDRLPKNNIYICPFCEEIVIPKKGSIKEHHFAHKPNSTCTANEETILHFNAKHFFLLNKEIKINFPSTVFPKLKSFFNSLDFKNIPINFNKILDYYNIDLHASVETKVGNYIADVLLHPPYDSEEYLLVIEIFVSHHMEPEKREYYKDHNIPYLELKPVATLNGFQYFVNDYYLNNFIDDYQEDAFQASIDYIYHVKREELLDIAKQELVEVNQFELHKAVALDELFKKIGSLNFRDHITAEIYKEMKSIPITAYGQVESAERLSSINMWGKSLKANGYYVNKEKAIIYDLIRSFQREGIEIEALIDSDYLTKRKFVTGFNFLIPSTTITGEVMSNIIKAMIKQLRDEVNFPF